MKTYFRRTSCPHCHKAYDSIEKECPSCGTKNEAFERGYPFEHHLRDAFPWQIAYFLIGWVGFQILGTIVQLAIQIVYTASHSAATQEELKAFMSQVGVAFGTTAGAYGLLLLTFIIFLAARKKLPALAKSFKSILPYIVGIGGGVLLLGVSIAYSMMASAIFNAAGIKPSVNANESSIRVMAKAFPVLAVIVFGLVGPFCEEMGYRVGLFGLTSRLGRVPAYFISALVFGAIHFSWTVFAQGTRDDIIIELVNIPNYLIAGVGLGFLYDRFGFAASFMAHATNNLVSVLVQLIPGGAS